MASSSALGATSTGRPGRDDRKMRDSPIPAVKVEYDDDNDDDDDDYANANTSTNHLAGRQLSATTNSPSPLRSHMTTDESTHANATSSSYNTSYFVPQLDVDTAMTDASGATDTGGAATATKPAASKKPKSVGRTAATTARSRGGGAVGSTSSSRSGSSMRGGKTGSSSSRKKLLKPQLKSRAGTNTASTTSPASPSIKRESVASWDGDDDEEEADIGGGFKDDDGDDDDDDDDDTASSFAGRNLLHPPHEDGGEISDDGPYCICRGPDDHRWMIQCDQCEDWFHGDCVKLDKELGENLVQSYICPNCSIPGRYVTRFRKMCSYQGCRKPARLYAADDASMAANPDDASYFCTDAHRDQWWDLLLNRMGINSSSSSNNTKKEADDKMAVDQITPAQLVAILTSSNQPGVAEMLLHGLTYKSNDPDALLTDEERRVMRQSAADRYRLAEQLVMCKKMLQLLDMAKERHYDAVKAGLIERDCCGYDERLEHVAVQPHFEHFIASPEGVAVFTAGKLGPFSTAAASAAAAAAAGDAEKVEKKEEDVDMETAKPDADADADDAVSSDLSGMCRKRKCKAHLGWLPTLGRDVRMQMQDLTRQAAVQRDNETRLRLAAVQRAFVKKHMASEVRFVADSDNSLSSLAGSDNDVDDDKSSVDEEEEEVSMAESFKDAQSRQYSSRSASRSRSRSSRSRSPGYRNGYRNRRQRSYSRSQDGHNDDDEDDAVRRRPGRDGLANGSRNARRREAATPRSVDTYSD